MTYEAWRCTYQSSEQAARAAYKTAEKLAEQRDELLDALKTVMPYVVTEVIACHGLKCRESICESCNPKAEESANKAGAAYQAANAVIAKAEAEMAKVGKEQQ